MCASRFLTTGSLVHNERLACRKIITSQALQPVLLIRFSCFSSKLWLLFIPRSLAAPALANFLIPWYFLRQVGEPVQLSPSLWKWSFFIKLSLLTFNVYPVSCLIPELLIEPLVAIYCMDCSKLSESFSEARLARKKCISSLGLRKGLQGSRLQLRVKMEPADYLWVSIILVPLVLSCTENWELPVSRLSWHTSQALQQPICSLRVCTARVPLIFTSRNAFDVGLILNSDRATGSHLQSPVQSSHDCQKATICPQAESASSQNRVRKILPKNISNIQVGTSEDLYFIPVSIHLRLIWLSYFHSPDCTEQDLKTRKHKCPCSFSKTTEYLSIYLLCWRNLEGSRVKVTSLLPPKYESFTFIFLYWFSH